MSEITFFFVFPRFYDALLRYGCTVEAYDGIGNNRVPRRSDIKAVCTLGFSQLFILRTPILHVMLIVTNVFIGRAS